MMRLFALGCLLAAAGCGGDSKFVPKEATEEQKQKIAEEDRKVLDEESGGKGYGQKGKPGKK